MAQWTYNTAKSMMVQRDEGEQMLLQPHTSVRESGCGFGVTNKKNAFVMLCCGCFLLSSWFFVLSRSPVDVTVTLRTEKIFRNTSDKFLSVALDTSLIQERWSHLNLSSKKLLQMVQYLTPGYLRVGGTAADRLLFQLGAGSEKQPTSKTHSKDSQMRKSMSYRNRREMRDALLGPMDGDKWSYAEVDYNRTINNFTMTGEDWMMIYNFSKKAGFTLLFDLNVLLRDDDNWNSENARELIHFSEEHGFDVNWQLGNEPNSFPHVFNVNISGQQLGQDFNTLKNILGTFPRYANSLLVGPDVTRPKFIQDSSIHFLNQFLETANQSIDAVTWHQYYLNGHIAQSSDFLSPSTLNVLYKQIHAVRQVVRRAGNTPIWLSETGSAYGGGAYGLSDRFIAGFLWLDKLGVAARMGIDVVVRQSLYHGYYSLLEEKTLDPLPDWWLSVIYKIFVGPGVIQASTFLGHVRLYCHCTPLQVAHSTNGTITVFGINMLAQSAVLTLEGLPAPTSGTSAAAYILTGADGLTSKHVLLNGKLLRMRNDGSFPPLKPRYISYTSLLDMPPYSIGFFVLHGISVPACRG